MKDRASNPVVPSTRSSVIGTGKSSLGHALFKSLEIFTYPKLTNLLSNEDNVSQPSWVLNFVNEVSLYELIHLNIYLDCQLKTKEPLGLLCWFYAFRNSQLVSSDIWIQAWHVLITLSKYVFVFLEELFILCHFFII